MVIVWRDWRHPRLYSDCRWLTWRHTLISDDCMLVVGWHQGIRLFWQRQCFIARNLLCEIFLRVFLCGILTCFCSAVCWSLGRLSVSQIGVYAKALHMCVLYFEYASSIVLLVYVCLCFVPVCLCFFFCLSFVPFDFWSKCMFFMHAVRVFHVTFISGTWM